MKLYYHIDPLGNFGDDLNPWLWERLLPDVFDGICPHDPGLRKGNEGSDALFIGIGTLLNQNIPKDVPKAIFATGSGYGSDPVRDDSWHVYCVRGPRTAKKLGLSPDHAITDGAALVATLGLDRLPQRIPLAFMPHVSSARAGYWEAVCNTLGIHYIDPQGDVETVFGQLLATDRIITEAMHGAILADTLRIPWIPVTSNPNILAFKWLDWCESLDLPYEPQQLPSLWGSIEDTPWPRKALKLVKYNMAKQALRKAAEAAPQLSDETLFQQRLDQLQDRLHSFREDVTRGEYAV